MSGVTCANETATTTGATASSATERHKTPTATETGATGGHQSEAMRIKYPSKLNNKVYTSSKGFAIYLMMSIVGCVGAII
jgi:hypothetical protein